MRPYTDNPVYLSVIYKLKKEKGKRQNEKKNKEKEKTFWDLHRYTTVKSCCTMLYGNQSRERQGQRLSPYRDGGAGRVGSISRGGEGSQRPAAAISPARQRQTQAEDKVHVLRREREATDWDEAFDWDFNWFAFNRCWFIGSALVTARLQGNKGDASLVSL